MVMLSILGALACHFCHHKLVHASQHKHNVHLNIIYCWKWTDLRPNTCICRHRCFWSTRPWTKPPRGKPVWNLNVYMRKSRRRVTVNTIYGRTWYNSNSSWVDKQALHQHMHPRMVRPSCKLPEPQNLLQLPTVMSDLKTPPQEWSSSRCPHSTTDLTAIWWLDILPGMNQPAKLVRPSLK
jgi:hypothetical protein